MFGSGKIQGLESKISDLKSKLQQALKDKDTLRAELDKVNSVPHPAEFGLYYDL